MYLVTYIQIILVDLDHMNLGILSQTQRSIPQA